MLTLAALMYLLLALRVRIRTEAALWGTKGALLLSAEAAGVVIRFDGEIDRRENGIFLTLKPRYGRLSQKRKPGEERGKSIRLVKRYLWFARTGRMETLAFGARIGLGDAAQTAIAAGALRAVAAAAILRIDRDADCELRVVPDFEQAGFCAQARCIFSCQAGDIMLAALKAVLRNSRREGLDWKNIPLRA